MAKPPSAKNKAAARISQNADSPTSFLRNCSPRRSSGGRRRSPAVRRRAPAEPFREDTRSKASDETEHAQQDHHLGGFAGRDLQEQHEQRGRPERDAVDAGLGAGIAEPGHDRLRGYLNRSNQLVLMIVSCIGRGRQRQRRGSTCSAQASDLRASSYRPAGTASAAISAPRSEPAGPATPATRRSRTTLAIRRCRSRRRAWRQGRHRAESRRSPAPAHPAALGGRHELLHQRQVHAIEPADADSDEESHDREVHPAIVRREI